MAVRRRHGYVLGFLTLLASCEHAEDPVRKITPDHPPEIISYEPADLHPSMHVGQRIVFTFEARDPDTPDLDYGFTVNDSVVIKHNRFTFEPATPGRRNVMAIVSNGRSSATQAWEVSVAAAPDTIAPAPVEVTSFAATLTTGEAEAEWLAVGDDSLAGMASAYHLRYSLGPVLSEHDWSLASQYADVASTQPPGETIRATLVGLPGGRIVYLCVRAADDAGNLSPLADCPRATLRGYDLTGRVIDPLTGLGVPDAHVAFGARAATTDASGRYQFVNLVQTTSALFARDEIDPAIGAYFDYVLIYAVTHHDSVDVFLLPNLTLETQFYADFKDFFRQMTDIGGIPSGAETRRWSLPIDLFVPPMVKDGLDYEATIRRVAGEFDAILGRPVFHLVDLPPPVGVEVRYRDDIPRDNYWVETWTPDWYPEKARVEFRTTYAAASENALALVARHELGHVLGLNHSLDPAHVMVGGPAPSATRFSADEIAVLRCFYGIPRGWDNRLFLDD